MKNALTATLLTSRQQYLTAIGAVVGLMCAAQAGAATFTWDGGGSGRNWSTAANWVGDVGLNNDGTDDVVFDGTTTAKFNPRANVEWDINSITFQGSSQFTLTGFPSDIIGLEGGGVVNNSTVKQIVDQSILLFASQSFNANSGDLAFGRAVDTGSFDLTVTGANNTAMSGILSGGGILNKQGAGTLALSGANTFSGGLNVTGGAAILGSDAAAGLGTISLANGAALQAAGNRTVVNDLAIGAGGGTISGAGQLTLSGLITGGAITKSGAGVLNLAGNNGTFTSLVISGGTVALAGTGGNILADTAGVTLAGGTLDAQNRSETMGTLTLAAASTLQLQADSTPGTLTFGNVSFGSGLLTIKGWTSSNYDPNLPAVAGTDDRIFVTTSLNAGDLASWVTFEGYSSAVQLGTGEIVPVPEPTAIAGALGLLGLAGWRFCSRRKEQVAA